MLTKLAPECLELIINQLVCRSDVKRLCEVCKRIYNIAIPHLYKSLILSTAELSIPGLVNVIECIPLRYLKYTQEVGFYAPIHQRRERRCVHRDDPRLGDVAVRSRTNDLNSDKESDNVSTSHTFQDMMRNIALFEFPDNQLRSFRWELGTCIPNDMLRRAHPPLHNQKQIESIILVTDGECGKSIDTQYFVDLTQFEGLRSLEWRGLNRYADFQAVGECIAVHGHQIKSLTLNLVDWKRAEMVWIHGYIQRGRQTTFTRLRGNFFTHAVLGIHPGDQKEPLPSLNCLSLAGVSFSGIEKEMANALNVEQLQSLTLWNCPGSLRWLQLILDSGKTLKLKALEVAFDPTHFSLRSDITRDITNTISDFIGGLHGLEALYIMLPSPVNWSIVANKISKHSSSLRRLVTHHLGNMGHYRFSDGNMPWTHLFECMLQGGRLTYFGTSMSVRELLNCCQHMLPKLACKLIHLRTSGWALEGAVNFREPPPITRPISRRPLQPWQDVQAFAQWAFGIDGLPNLQVLAWGDFSYDRRYMMYNVVLCRTDDGYHTMTPAEIRSSELVQNNIDMLAACPVDSIMS